MLGACMLSAVQTEEHTDTDKFPWQTPRLPFPAVRKMGMPRASSVETQAQRMTCRRISMNLCLEICPFSASFSSLVGKQNSSCDTGSQIPPRVNGLGNFTEKKRVRHNLTVSQKEECLSPVMCSWLLYQIKP